MRLRKRKIPYRPAGYHRNRLRRAVWRSESPYRVLRAVRRRAAAADAGAGIDGCSEAGEFRSVAQYSGGNADDLAGKPDRPNDGAGQFVEDGDASGPAAGQRVGVANDGYWGIPVRPSTTTGQVSMMAADPFKARSRSLLRATTGATVFAQADVTDLTADWKQYSVTLKTADVPESATNRFVISTATPGVVWFNLVSLFPPTYNDRPNGNRIDIMQKLVDMKPSFRASPGAIMSKEATRRIISTGRRRSGRWRSGRRISAWNYRSSDGWACSNSWNGQRTCTPSRCWRSFADSRSAGGMSRRVTISSPTCRMRWTNLIRHRRAFDQMGGDYRRRARRSVPAEFY